MGLVLLCWLMGNVRWALAAGYGWLLLIPIQQINLATLPRHKGHNEAQSCGFCESPHFLYRLELGDVASVPFHHLLVGEFIPMRSV